MINRKTLIAFLLLTVSGYLAAAPELVEVPHPILDEYKPDIRAMLAGARGRFEIMAADSDEQQLGIAYGRLGVHYYAHSVQDAARACFQNASLLDPQNFRWPYYLGVHYAETGFFQSAARELRKVLRLQPGDVPAATRLGLAFLELGESDVAESEFQAVLAVDQANAPALAGMARVAENREDWRAAVDYYLQALQAQPEASQLNYRLGQVYRRLGEVDKARSHLAERGSRIPSIDDPLLQLMDAHSKPADYYIALADRTLSDGDAERAWKLYDVARAIDPSHAGPLAGMARILFLNGDGEQAGLLVDRALQMQPDHGSALQLKGMMDERAGDLESAVRNYKNSIEMADHPQTRFMLANALMRLGRFNEALVQYDVLADAENASVEALYRAGIANIAVGNCQNAESRLLAAYQSDPGLGKVVLALARVYATCFDSTDAQRDTALKYAEALYEGQPGLETSETLAMTLAAKSQFEDAIDFQTQAIFEALKTGSMEMQPQLKENMDRYRQQQPAALPWPPGHAVFSGQRQASQATGE